MNPILVPLLFLLALLAGCTNSTPAQAPATSEVTEGSQPLVPGCQGCHAVTVEQPHDLPCVDCHGGEAQASVKEAAHSDLVARPAHPESMAAVCGRCHGQQVEQLAKASHLTVAKQVDVVRQAFGAKERLASLTLIPRHAAPSTPLALAEDLLRRRCLRCHLYAPGDGYAAVRHGTGCAACHLAFANGGLASHQILARPTDQQCLSCHYGNRVGADFYGRFEHDHNEDYRTPFQFQGEGIIPYGVGFHQLSPDRHQQAGMVCIDCHGGQELMAGGPRLTCLSCHDRRLGADAPATLSEADGRRQLRTVAGTPLVVPVLRDAAHDRYQGKVGCQVCHGQWSFADHGNHLLRLDTPDYEDWRAMTRQGSAEVESTLEAALFLDGHDRPPSMGDGITGATAAGIWLQAYELRRWEEINTCLDEQGVLQVCRPSLDLHLSYVNQDGEVVFDGVRPLGDVPVMRPYTPHTTGRAGAFYQERLGKIRGPGRRLGP